MPTVTAIALESLLEPGSAAPATHRLRRNSACDPTPSGKEHLGAASASSQENHHRHHVHVHHHSGHREQQPVFLSGRPREASQAAGPPADGGERAAQAAGSRVRSSGNGYYISPKLYITPEPTQIVPTGGVSSNSPNSVSSPSPYVVNHKRRDVPRRPPPPPLSVNVAAASNGNFAPSSSVTPKGNLDELDSSAKPSDHGMADTVGGLSNRKAEVHLDAHREEMAARGGDTERIEKVAEQEENALGSRPYNNGVMAIQRSDSGIDDDEDDDFFDPRELMSVMSSSDTEDTASFRRGSSGKFHSPLTSHNEFFDATEDFLSDGSFSRSSPSARSNIEADLRSMRLNLFEEIDKRKKAEETLDHMQNVFGRMIRRLAQVESIPDLAGESIQYDVDTAAQFCQEVVVMRFVSEALQGCLARVETEAAAEAIFEAKNHEISRLRDRLQYYEAMNQEMSQRNQEAIEIARRRRQARKVRRKWIWGIGLSVAVGASLLTYSYVTHGAGGDNPSLPSGDQHDLPPDTTAISGGSSA